LIDHVHLKVRDVAASRAFYDAAFNRSAPSIVIMPGVEK
jgi:catechol 2,3-dioxygenase-like lactoylglutathione lyase family enzyme